MRSRLGTCGRYLTLVLLTACSGTRRAAPPPEVIPPGGTAPDTLTSPFFPANYKAALLVDYAALRECGLLAHLERMPMFESWLTANARQFGCELDDLDRVHTAVEFEEWGPGSDKVHWRLISVAETAAVMQQFDRFRSTCGRGVNATRQSLAVVQQESPQRARHHVA